MKMGDRIRAVRTSPFGVAKAGDLGTIVEILPAGAVRCALDRGGLATLRKHEFETVRDGAAGEAR